MSDQSEEEASDYEAEVFRLLEDGIRDELEWHTGFVLDLELSPESLDSLAGAVAAQLAYGFSFKWDPDWVEPGKPHVWRKDGRAFARCTVCLAVSPPVNDIPAAHAWHRTHRQMEHSDVPPPPPRPSRLP